MVTVPNPEEQDRRGDATRPGGQGSGPADTDAAFADIVAGWRAEPDAPHWPADEDDFRTTPDPAYPPALPTGDGDEGHFEPPEPPPFPVPRPRTLGGVALLAVGVLLLVQPGLLNVGAQMGTPLGLLALTAGIGWLVLGLRTGPPSEGRDAEGWDDGARL
ncbi:MAG: DUF308 domain-containing protein [Pseudonocardiaceae bacterium]